MCFEVEGYLQKVLKKNHILKSSGNTLLSFMNILGNFLLLNDHKEKMSK